MNENENINLNNAINVNVPPTDGPINITKQDVNIENNNNVSINPDMNWAANNNAMPPQKPKKNGMIIGIIIATALVVIAGILAFLFLFTTTFKSPKQKVMLAFSRTLSNQSFIAKLSGNTKEGLSKGVLDDSNKTITAILDTTAALKDKAYETDYSLKLENITNEGKSIAQEAYGAGIHGSSITDINDKLSYNNIYLNYNGFNVIDIDTYLDDSVLMIASDDLFDGYIAIDTANVEANLEGSYIGDLLKKTNEDLYDELCSIDYNYFDTMNKAANNSKNNLPILNEQDLKPLKDLYNSIEVKSNNTFATYNIGDKKVKAYNYNVHIPKDAFLDFAYDYSIIVFDSYREYIEGNEDMLSNLNVSSLDEFNDKIDELQDSFEDLIDELDDTMEDIDFQVYIDNKCRLIAIRYQGSSETESTTLDIDFNMEFTGYPYLCNDIYTELYIGDDDDNSSTFRSLYSVTEDKTNKKTSFYIDADNNSYVCTLIDMQYTYDTKKGEYDFTTVLFDGLPQTPVFTIESNGTLNVNSDSFEFEFDSLSFTEETAYGAENSLELSGDISMAPAKEDIELPDGPEYDIFEIDDTDIMKLGEEIYDNLKDSPIFGNFM